MAKENRFDRYADRVPFVRHSGLRAMWRFPCRAGQLLGMLRGSPSPVFPEEKRGNTASVRVSVWKAALFAATGGWPALVGDGNPGVRDDPNAENGGTDGHRLSGVCDGRPSFRQAIVSEQGFRVRVVPARGGAVHSVPSVVGQDESPELRRNIGIGTVAGSSLSYFPPVG